MLIGNVVNKRVGKSEIKKRPGLGFRMVSNGWKGPKALEKKNPQKNRLFKLANVWKWPKTDEQRKEVARRYLLAKPVNSNPQLLDWKKKNPPPPNSCSERGGNAAKLGVVHRKDISPNNTSAAARSSLGRPLLSERQRDLRPGFHGSGSWVWAWTLFVFFGGGGFVHSEWKWCQINKKKK